MAGKKLLSLAADIFPHYFTSASQAFLVTLTMLPDLVFFALLSFPSSKTSGFLEMGLYPSAYPVGLRRTTKVQDIYEDALET